MMDVGLLLYAGRWQNHSLWEAGIAFKEAKEECVDGSN